MCSKEYICSICFLQKFRSHLPSNLLTLKFLQPYVRTTLGLLVTHTTQVLFTSIACFTSDILSNCIENELNSRWILRGWRETVHENHHQNRDELWYGIPISHQEEESLEESSREREMKWARMWSFGLVQRQLSKVSSIVFFFSFPLSIRQHFSVISDLLIV